MARKWYGPIVLTLVFSAWGGIARADTSPPPMTGLTFQKLITQDNGDVTASIDCHPDGTSTVTFAAHGETEGGFYPGTFTESGTLTIGQLGTNGLGPVEAFGATFTVASGATTITGTKSLGTTFPPTNPLFTPDLANTASCSTGGGLDTFVFFGLFDYQARIATPDGAFRDSGTGDLILQTLDFSDGSHFSRITQTFSSSNGVTPAGPDTLTLSPPDATNPVGTTHTVTATATGGGQPSAGVTVRFTVSGSVNTTGSCVTDANGQCSFSYTGPQLPGADMISAYADTNGSGSQDAGEPAAVPATKAWILPTSTPGQVTGGGQVWNASGTDKAAFGFNAKNQDGRLSGECTVVDPQASVQVKCTDVTAIVVSGTHATIFGDATVNGTATTYRIDTDDVAEPGKGADTFTLSTATGYHVGGTLTAGNVQVHN